VRGVIVDFGGVMTEPPFGFGDVDPAYLQLLAFFLEDMRDVYHLTDGAHDIHLMETGRISEREFFSRLCRRYQDAGHEPIDAHEAERAVFGRTLVASAAMIDAVRQLKAAGFRTALLTNISRNAGHQYRSLMPGELFDAVVDSSVVGLRKPDPAVYRLACERLGLEPAECIFVDDLVCNVQAARALGMEVIHCLDPVEVADQLVRGLLGQGAAAQAESA
jgi:putative hydrolase of the HAD superfamily